MADQDNTDVMTLAAEIVAAYVSNNQVEVGQVPDFIRQTMKALSGEDPFPLAQAEPAPDQARKLTPAQIRKSITPDGIVSFEDGRPYKTMKRHLGGRGLTPDQYREKWGLPKDYPMVSPNYSAARSQMAKNIGLGQKGRGARAKAAGKGRKGA